MNKKGFTLIEILIVIVILGTLATLALPKITAQIETARAAEAMNIFGFLRRSMTDCLSMANCKLSSCNSAPLLNVDIPPAGLGQANFTYQMGMTFASPYIDFRARRDADHAICMRLNLDLKKVSVVSVNYISWASATVAHDPFAGIVARIGVDAGALTCDKDLSIYLNP